LHRRLTALLCLLIAAGAGAAETAALRAGTFTPPRRAPDFSLVGSNGAELRLSKHRGKVVLLSFGFTSCPDVCPTTLAVLAQTRRVLGPQGRELQVIYVTVDPERDDAQRMRSYLAAFDPTFLGGTGSEQALAAVRKEYGIFASRKRLGSSYTVAHSSFTYLIDRQGWLRGLMPYGRTPEDYAHDVRILLQG
jgi:protein SCO1/2